ncbi:flagellar hook-associated protein FlgK [Magnetovibrio sp.]|uniref:flagellar hook-associated protein FlgK n=1 Tax=Magnetovibrio sp. TaxID=2024836 RepID=UPI002F94E62C
MAMDLRAARNAAVSALTTSEYQTSISSKNIANASVEGYSVKRSASQTTMSGGVATGVRADKVSSYMNEDLVKSLVDATSRHAYSTTKSAYLEKTLNTFGTPYSADSLSHKTVNVQAAVGDLVVTPESTTQKEAAVSSFGTLADELNTLSDGIQKQRTQIDSQIDQKVDELNQKLANIESLNAEISTRTVKGESTADLQDRRRIELEEVSSLLEVTYFETANKELHIYTTDGKPLVDSHARELSYTPAGTVTSGTAYPGGFDAVVLSGRDITGSLKSGEIGALIELRDDTLVAKQAELDAFAKTLIDGVNAAHNVGTPNPPLNAVTGSEVQIPGNAFSGTGTMRLALVDSTGIAVSVADLDLSLYPTNQQLADAINAIPGLSAGFDAGGHLTISSDNPSLGVSVGEMDSAVGASGIGVSSFFGFNSVFTGTSSDTIAVHQDLIDNPKHLSTGQLNAAAGLTVGDQALSAGDASVAQAMEEALSQDYAFGQIGDLGAQTSTLSEYATSILSSLSVEASIVDDAAQTEALVHDDLKLQLNNESGVNLDEETAKITALEEHYSASAQVLGVLSEMFDSLLHAVSR